MAARNSTTIVINLFDLIKKPVEIVFRVVSSFRNRGVYGPVLRAWTVRFHVVRDGCPVPQIRIPEDDGKTFHCEQRAKELAITHVAERFGQNTEALKANVLPGTNEVVVYVENEAWRGPDGDDEYLMSVL